MVARGDHEITIPVETHPLPELHLGALWLRVVCGIVVLLLGAVSFILVPGSRTAWLFLIFCVSLEVLLEFNVALARFADIYTRIQPIAFAASSAIGLHMFLELPRRVRLVERHPMAVVLPYLPAIPLVAGALVLPYPGRYAPWFLLTTASEVASVVSGACTLGILIVGYRRAASDEPLRSRYATLILGVAIGLFVPIVIHTARALLGFGLDKVVVHINAAPVVVYGAATAYALLRQNVLGADRLTTQVVSYAATLLLVGAGCGLVLIGVPVLARESIARTPLALVLVTAVASLSLVPAYRRLKRAVDRRFMRDKVSDERMATELRELMRTAMLGDPVKTLSGAFQALDVLKPEKVELWLREVDAFHRRRGEGEAPPPAPVDGPLGRAVREEKLGGVAGLCNSMLSPEAQGELWGRGLALLAPVLVHGDVRGFVALGRQASGARYRSGEESFLGMVAVQIGQALERDEGGTSVGKYRLEKRLGMGGMAEVYLARQVGMAGFERRVALKRPLPHLAEDPAFLGMFIDEAKLAAQLHHPNIVATYEVDRHQGSYYIAMEYVEGSSLRSLLRAHRASGDPPPLPVALAIIDALLGALAYAHGAADTRGRALGLVHRDVSPGNVMVSTKGEVKLTDFGVARSASRISVTQTGVVKGTLAYMAPEQAAGKKVDGRSDLFGAGAVLTEILTSSPPYPDGPPSEAGEVAALVRRALCWDPDARFATAAEMQLGLRAVGVKLATPEEIAAWAQLLRDKLHLTEELHEAATVQETRV